MYRISQVRLEIEEIKGKGDYAISLENKRDKEAFLKKEEGLLRNAIVRDLRKARGLRKAGVSKSDIRDVKIIKRSLDARRKWDIHYVYTLAFESDLDLNLPEAKEREYKSVNPQREFSLHKPVIVGMGPCGLFASLILAEAGYEPILIDRGEAVEKRTSKINKFWTKGILDEDSNVLFGEGGAGTFSDGKLTTGISDPRIFKVLKTLVDAGGPPDLLYANKPHIGTDVLRRILKNVRKSLVDMGVDIRFSSRMVKILTDSKGSVKGIELLDGSKIDTDTLVLATGHSARDVFRMVRDIGADIAPKAFSIGARIVHPQWLIDQAQYGAASLGNILGAAEYKLSARTATGRGCYSFCMCPGGKVILAASEPAGFTTNGMSNSRREGRYANSALLVDVDIDDFKSNDPLAGVEYQRKYERLAFEKAGGYKCLETDWEGLESSKLAGALPKYAIEGILDSKEKFNRKIAGFSGQEARFKGPETRSSSPVRIIRDRESLQSNIGGLYPAGEGAGYAGGIMSAAVDGIRIAEKIIGE